MKTSGILIFLLAICLSILPLPKLGSKRDKNDMVKVSLWHDTGAMTQTIMGIAFAGIMLFVMLFVWATLKANMPDVNDSAYNATVAKVSENVYNAMEILTVGIVIAAIMFIVMLVMRTLGRAGGGGFD